MTIEEENTAKQVGHDTTSRGSAGGRSQGARKRKSAADANAEKVKAEKERDELREALSILEGLLRGNWAQGRGSMPVTQRTGHVLHV